MIHFKNQLYVVLTRLSSDGGSHELHGGRAHNKLEQFFGKLAARDWPPDTDPVTFTKITQIFEQEIAF